jgi:hypothetical protein
LLIRRDQRAAELAAFKEKTRSVLKTFDMRTNEATRDQKPSWFSEHTIDVTIHKIGVAFPIPTSYSCREHQSPQIIAKDQHKRVTWMAPMTRALALTIALSHKIMPYHTPTSKLRLLRLLVPHLTEIRWGGKFWTPRGAAASVIGNV